MRGRTNVLGFSEDFINADVINAVADETIQIGNFVKFYDAINGGFETGLYFHNIKELTDGRLMCIGYNTSTSIRYAVILERDSAGNFVKNLPSYELNSEWGSIDGNIFDADDDTIGCFSVYGNNSTSQYGVLYIKVIFLKFNILTDQIEQTVRTLTVSDIPSYLYGQTGSYPTYVDREKEFSLLSPFYNFVKVGSDIYIFVNTGYRFRYSTAASFFYSYALFCMKVTLGSDNAVSYGGGRVIAQYSSPTQSSNFTYYRFIGQIFSVYSASGSGFFLYYRSQYYSQSSTYHKLQFIPDSSFTVNTDALPSVISFETKFTDNYEEFTPFAVNGDDLFLIRIVGYGANNVNWFKIHFYDYTVASYSYLIYDEVYTGISSVAYSDNNGLDQHNGLNYCFLYEDLSIKRYYFSFLQSGTRKVISILLDVDKTDSLVISNPAVIEDDVASNYNNLGFNLDNILYSQNDSFIVPHLEKVLEYKIVNDSELSGAISQITHVLNGTDINYIQGVAKQSGTSGQTIECYKAKVS